ncbi:TPA: hypothetical protein HA243_03355 [Candidatus Micrarchaeota archaeon]|nr:hypothetical protein [Candidatus Micrarchaeota archaeon]
MDWQAKMAVFAFGLMLLLPAAYPAATYDDCLNAITTMSPAIKGAQSSMDALNSKLADANKYGISSPYYSSAATSAQSLLTKAKAAEHSASADFAGAEYDTCINDATSAQNSALKPASCSLWDGVSSGLLR